MRRDMVVPGAMREITLADLGSLGVERFEVTARFVRASGMIDDRMWLLSREELEAACALLPPSEESERLIQWLGRG